MVDVIKRPESLKTLELVAIIAAVTNPSLHSNCVLIRDKVAEFAAKLTILERSAVMSVVS